MREGLPSVSILVKYTTARSLRPFLYTFRTWKIPEFI